MKIELKHLAPYLPYGLKMWDEENKNQYIPELIGIKNDERIITTLQRFPYSATWSLEEFKPILRPLSELTKPNSRLSGMNFVDWSCVPNYEMRNLESLIDAIKTKKINHNIWGVLIEQHFDVFGLIEKGLAIDINTINPQ